MYIRARAKLALLSSVESLLEPKALRRGVERHQIVRAMSGNEVLLMAFRFPTHN